MVIPCLNEADTLATCIEKAIRAFRSHNIRGEIIVADNGSTDGSQEIALQMETAWFMSRPRVWQRPDGWHLSGQGQIHHHGRCRRQLRFRANSSVRGETAPGLRPRARLPTTFRRGQSFPGAMPSCTAGWGTPCSPGWPADGSMPRSTTSTAECAASPRRFTTGWICRCTGMEFATEMIIKASLYRHSIAEVPITLHPDGRKAHPPHLKTFRDGWRTLRFFLICSPRWLFSDPGIFLFLVGVCGYILALPASKSSVLPLMLIPCLSPACLFFPGLPTYPSSRSLLKPLASVKGYCRQILAWIGSSNSLTLEKGLILGGLCVICGLALIIVVVNEWRFFAFRATGIRSHHALGNSRSSADYPGSPEHFLQLHGEHYRSTEEMRLADLVHENLVVGRRARALCSHWPT